MTFVAFMNYSDDFYDTHINNFLVSAALLNHSHDSSNIFYILMKVSNMAKIRNRQNQIPHLTQDTTW